MFEYTVTSLFTSLVIAGTTVVTFFANSLDAQQSSSTAEEPTEQLSPQVLEKIREAPFSELFTVGSAQAVKDRDYKASQSEIGFFSLWADIPERDFLQVAVQYCLTDRKIADSNAYLAEIILMDGDRELVTIDKAIKERVAQSKTVESGEYVPTTFLVTNPYYDSFWAPSWNSYGYATASYIPPVECSFGRSRFDLTPVKEAIAQLPNKTLDVKLLFNNGMSEKWRLGSKTVEVLMEFPTIENVSVNSP
jgi:hypothetical protein